MNSRQTLRLLGTRLEPVFLAFCLGMASFATAAEPLAGPIVGSRWWKIPREAGNPNDVQTQERLIEADIPVPIKAGIAMPFLTLRYRERRAPKSANLSQDQRFGVGFLHHAAEGDPAWRADFIRFGRTDLSPSFNSRLIANLIKPFPWMKLRPSDNILSWVGINYLTRSHSRPLIIPELSWYRQGAEGLIIDINAPRHFHVGLNAGLFTFKVGAEQEWLHWQNENTEDSWILRRLSRVSLAFTPTPNWMLTSGVLHDLKSENIRENIGIEISLRWIPGL